MRCRRRRSTSAAGPRGAAGEELIEQALTKHCAAADLGFAVPVHGGLCFVDTELPLSGTPSINGLRIFGRRGLVRQLNAAGGLTPDAAAAIAATLAERFPWA